MSEHLSAEELSHLRHELRTPLNHLLGYSDMLAEQVRDDGRDGYLPDLEGLRAGGDELLALVNDAVGGAQEVDRHQLLALAGALNERLDVLEAETGRLRERAAGADPDLVPDLERIARALGNLRRLAGTLTDPRASSPAGDLLHLPDSEGAPAKSASPARRPAGVEEAPVEEEFPPPTAWGRVLVVDDNEANRDLLYRRLRRQGHAVEQAADGREALAHLEHPEGAIDLVLLDIRMPEVDGYEVLRAVKGSPAWRDIPVIMISAVDEIESVVRCIEMGAEDYLPKPFDPVILRARVGACLEKKRLREQELAYLRGVAAVASAAGEVEAGAFVPGRLDDVAARADELGRLARVFERMAREVAAREQRWKAEVEQLRIEINEARKQHEVAAITGSDYFQSLKGRAEALRRKLNEGKG